MEISGEDKNVSSRRTLTGHFHVHGNVSFQLSRLPRECRNETFAAAAAAQR